MDYEYYKPCLDALENLIGQDNDRLQEFDSYNSQLKRLLSEQSKYEDQRGGVGRVLDNLNRLSREVTHRSFVEFCDEVREKPRRIVDLGDPANFDLDEFDKCLEDLLLSSGLLGISVAITSGSRRNFPKYLQKRLKAVLAQSSGGEVFVPSSVSLKASLGSIDALVEDLIHYKLRLTTSDVLLTVLADEEDRFSRFWQKLTNAFSSSFENCFLVLVIKESMFKPPRSIEHDFSTPEFHRDHVVKWVVSLANNLIDDRTIKRKLISDWTEAIMLGCTQDQKLQIDRVYDHIEMSLDRLKRGNSIDVLYQFFEEWKQLYAQTPP